MTTFLLEVLKGNPLFALPAPGLCPTSLATVSFLHLQNPPVSLCLCSHTSPTSSAFFFPKDPYDYIEPFKNPEYAAYLKVN